MKRLSALERKKGRAISTIVATILTINMAIVMGAVLWVWGTGLLGTYTSGTGVQYMLLEERKEEAIVIENVWFESGTITVFVKNIGTRDAKITTIYVQGTPFTSYNTSLSLPKSINVGERLAFKISTTWTSGVSYRIVVATARGNQARGDWVA